MPGEISIIPPKQESQSLGPLVPLATQGFYDLSAYLIIVQTQLKVLKEREMPAQYSERLCFIMIRPTTKDKNDFAKRISWDILETSHFDTTYDASHRAQVLR